MARSFAAVHETSKRHNVHMRTAALVKAIDRVAEFTRVRGIYPIGTIERQSTSYGSESGPAVSVAGPDSPFPDIEGPVLRPNGWRCRGPVRRATGSSRQ